MDRESESSEATLTRSPLVFISHDTRDAELAEAFSRLLSSVSAGVLKSFRSSDKKGNQGIEYGVEWYPEIMKKLETASDVVCLLTPQSVGRPWLLYEAGVAKGKLETPVHGVAIGIPLQTASAGPFAQFQNSDDSEDALTQLVMQLVRRIPGAEPDRDVVKMQVSSFRTAALELAKPHDTGRAEQRNTEDGASVVKIFEEVKVMFQDLPRRIESRIDPDYPSRRRRKYPMRMLHDVVRGMGRDLPDGVALMMATSLYREEFPWLYDMAADVFRKISSKDAGATEALEALDHVFHITLEHPAFREVGFRSKDRFFEFEEFMPLLHDAISRSLDRVRSRTSKLTDLGRPSEDDQGQLEATR